MAYENYMSHTAKTKYRNFETNIPRKGISGFQSQFPHSCVCERFIYSHDRSAYSAGGRPIHGIYNLVTHKNHKILSDKLWQSLFPNWALQSAFSQLCSQAGRYDHSLLNSAERAQLAKVRLKRPTLAFPSCHCRGKCRVLLASSDTRWPPAEICPPPARCSILKRSKCIVCKYNFLFCCQCLIVRVSKLFFLTLLR